MAMTFLSATAIRVIRKHSYRVFIIIHVVVIMTLPPSIWLHVRTAEKILVLIADMAARTFRTATCPATIDMIPGTNLIKAVVVLKLPLARLRRFTTHPAFYAYLSVPQATCLPSGIMSSPFRVAPVNEETGDPVFVARRTSGPTTRTLARLAWPRRSVCSLSESNA